MADASWLAELERDPAPRARLYARLLRQPLWWEGEETVALLRRAAQAALPPGTLYEVLSSLPGDFGRQRVSVCLNLEVHETSLMPYVPGQQRVDLARGCVLRCRESVPEREPPDV